MFVMDVPSATPQEPLIVLAQASAPAAAGAIPLQDFILNECQETVSAGDPSSAVRTVDPAYMLKNYYGSFGYNVDLSSIRVTLLQASSHGKITSVIDNTGRPWYAYDAEPNYVGNDKAVFIAEFEGKRYKIVLQLHVFEGPATPGDFGASTCPDPRLIKVTKPVKPSSGSSSYELNSITVTFAALSGAALGQTTVTTGAS